MGMGAFQRARGAALATTILLHGADALVTTAAAGAVAPLGRAAVPRSPCGGPAPQPLRLYGGQKPKREVAGVELMVMMMLWYALNVGWNLCNKNLCNMLKLPITASAMQMIVGCSMMMSTWALKMRKMPNLEDWHNAQLRGLGVVHALAQCTTITAFSVGTVSFVSVIKSLEPLFSAALGVPLLGDRLPMRCWMSMLPVCGGIALASLGEISFSWVCLFWSQASNMCYALRSVWFKKVFDEAKQSAKEEQKKPRRKMVGKSGWTLCATTGFPVASVWGTLIVILSACVLERQRWAEGSLNLKAAGKSTRDLMLLVVLTGFFQYTNDEMSFVVLEYLSAVTQSVVNTFKRVFVISAAAYYFQTPMSSLGIGGVAIAVAGMLLYSIVMDGYRTEQRKAQEARKAAAQPLGVVIKRSLSWIP